jgi:hypothetical protein
MSHNLPQKPPEESPEIAYADKWLQRLLTYIPLPFGVLAVIFNQIYIAIACFLWIATAIGYAFVKKLRDTNTQTLELTTNEIFPHKPVLELKSEKKQDISEIIPPNIKIEAFASVNLKFDSPVFLVTEKQSKFWAYVITFQNAPNPPEKVGSVENVEAQISIYPLYSERTYFPILHGCWVDEPTSFVSFPLNKTHSLILGAFERKNVKVTDELITFEYSSEKLKPIRKTTTFKFSVGFHIAVKLIAGKHGEFKTPLPVITIKPHQKGLPEIKTKIGQEIEFRSEYEEARRKYLIERLAEFIEHKGQFNSVKTYKPTIEQFLDVYFDKTYVKNFREKGIIALEELLKELLD